MNKPISLYLLFPFILLLTFNVTIHSQNFDTQLNFTDSTQVHLVILKNGKRLKGRIIEIQNTDVYFFHKKTKQKDTLNLIGISKIKVQGHLDGWKKNYKTPYQYSHYLFYTNTSFGLKEKDKNYRTFMGASMLIDYGIGDGVSVGIGYSFPLIFSANMKFTGQIAPKARAGFKSLVLTIPVLISSNDNFTVFENSAMFTFGNPNRFLNFSFSNYYINTERRSFRSNFGFPKIYNSFSIGSGLRLSEKWQLILENHVNFNFNFIDGKFLPSFGLSYTNNQHNFAIGYHSTNQLGFNSIPIIDFSEDDIVLFTNSFFSRLPYFTYSKIF